MNEAQIALTAREMGKSAWITWVALLTGTKTSGAVVKDALAKCDDEENTSIIFWLFKRP